MRTRPADKSKVKALVEAIVSKAKDESFEAITFNLEKLPGNATNSPTLALDHHDALDQLYVRAQRLEGFPTDLDGCYENICDEIEQKMITIVKSAKGW